LHRKKAIANSSWPERNLTMKGRSAYSPSNSLRWKKYFDKLIETSSSFIIPYTNHPHLTHATFQNRINDGLKWLCEHDLREFIKEEECEGVKFYSPEDYKQLRAKLKFHVNGDGIYCAFNALGQTGLRNSKNSLTERLLKENAAGDPKVISSLDDNNTWREELQRYLENDAEQGIFYRAGVVFREIDLKWIEQVCVGLVVKQTSDSITVIK